MSSNIRCEYDGDPLIPEGDYQATCIASEIKSGPWGYKVRLDLEISDGKYDGTKLTRYYNIKSSKKPTSDGEVQWIYGAKSTYIREYRRLFGKTNGDYPHTTFDGKSFQVVVVCVKQDSKKRDIGKINYYSKVDHIIKEINPESHNEKNLWD